MSIQPLFSGKRIFFFGIKGTGMASLAVLAVRMGAFVQGVDTTEEFITDMQLSLAGIRWQSFDTCTGIPVQTDLVVASSAYLHPEHHVLAAARQCGVQVISYPGFLALLSQAGPCHGVAGTHGKTTTAACAAHMLAPAGLGTYAVYGGLAGAPPAAARTGKQMRRSSGADVLVPDPFACISGDRIGILESCEYRDHLLQYSLDTLLVTSIEQDHPDWFSSESAVHETFRRAVMQLPSHGLLICCADDPGSRSLAAWTAVQRPDLDLITYGMDPKADVRIRDVQPDVRETAFCVGQWAQTFHTSLPGIEFLSDVVGAAVLAASIVLRDAGLRLSDVLDTDPVLPALLQEARTFSGVMGRLERRALVRGVQFIDDYAHHPTQIAAVIAALRQWYPLNRLVIIFRPHTRSRTEALFDAFVDALSGADLVVVQHTYAARSDGDPAASPEARRLADAVGGYFSADDGQALAIMADLLQDGDVCVTLGAGNNRRLSDRFMQSVGQSAGQGDSISGGRGGAGSGPGGGIRGSGGSAS